VRLRADLAAQRAAAETAAGQVAELARQLQRYVCGAALGARWSVWQPAGFLQTRTLPCAHAYTCSLRGAPARRREAEAGPAEEQVRAPIPVRTERLYGDLLDRPPLPARRDARGSCEGMLCRVATWHRMLLEKRALLLAHWPVQRSSSASLSSSESLQQMWRAMQPEQVPL
jgi:hypothetical protein